MKEFIEKLISRLKRKHIPYLGMDNSVPYGTEMVRLFDAIEIVNQLAEEYNNDVCEWKQDDKEIDVYYTKCGQAHIFIDGSPAENNHEFCPYCGKKIKVVE